MRLALFDTLKTRLVRRKPLIGLGADPTLLGEVVVLTLLMEQDHILGRIIEFALREQFAAHKLSAFGRHGKFQDFVLQDPKIAGG